MNWCGDPRASVERARAGLYVAATDEAWRYIQQRPYRFGVRSAYGSADPRKVSEVVARMIPFPEELRATLLELHAESEARRRRCV